MNLPRTLVIGGGGFIGGHVVAALCSAGAEVAVLDFAAPSTVPPKVSWITGSITEATLVASAVAGVEAVIFLANASLPGSSQINMAQEAEGHVATTLRVAEICKELGVRRFLFASSGGTVYGCDASSHSGLTENELCRPLNGYGVSKLSIEHYLRLMGQFGSMRTLSLRISNPYGKGQRPLRAQGVVAAAMQHAINGTTMSIWGDGSYERDFIYVSDVADAFLAALMHDGMSTEINVGSGNAVSINQIVAAVGKATGRSLRIEYLADRPIDVHRNVLDITRAQAELGWRPQVDLSSGLALTAEWWCEQL